MNDPRQQNPADNGVGSTGGSAPFAFTAEQIVVRLRCFSDGAEYWKDEWQQSLFKQAADIIERLAWIEVSRALPPLEVPVWLYVPGIASPFVGVRTLDDGGWLWARCYSDFYWCNKSAANGQPDWQTDTAEADDFKPTHWQPLPALPNINGEPRARRE